MRLMLTPADAATALKGDPGISRRVAWSAPLPLAEVKHIAHSHKATVNDVLLAAVSGALRPLPAGAAAGPSPRSRRWSRSTCARSTSRSRRKLGNKFGLAFLPLPVDQRE